MKHDRAISIILTLILTGSSTVFAAPSEPVTFSFASDDFENGPTFIGMPGHAIAGKAALKLYIDLNHDLPGGKVTIDTIFKFKGTTYNYSVVPYGTQWMHLWRVRGQFYFYENSAGTPLLWSAYFWQATLSSISPSKFDAGDTLTLQDAETVDPNMVFTPYPALLPYGIGTNDLHFGEDFTFTFTSTKPMWVLIALTPSGDFVNNWSSEGSFSATAIRY